ncbi:hypothetical protein V6N12_062447 [Hibiscus sabdariffa]|uniref:Uncharacterized protein n=1 Tax=Hibiscus sabdariffa TaxID=183260 RepID=A0ABR2F8V3_9ROSI
MCPKSKPEGYGGYAMGHKTNGPSKLGRIDAGHGSNSWTPDSGHQTGRLPNLMTHRRAIRHRQPSDRRGFEICRSPSTGQASDRWDSMSELPNVGNHEAERVELAWSMRMLHCWRVRIQVLS